MCESYRNGWPGTPTTQSPCAAPCTAVSIQSLPGFSPRFILHEPHRTQLNTRAVHPSGEPAYSTLGQFIPIPPRPLDQKLRSYRASGDRYAGDDSGAAVHRRAGSDGERRFASDLQHPGCWLDIHSVQPNLLQLQVCKSHHGSESIGHT